MSNSAAPATIGPNCSSAHQSRIVGDIADDRRPDEVALAVEHLAAGNDLAVPLGILEEALDLLELRLVLQRTHLRPLLQPVIDHRLARQASQFVADLSYCKSWT